MGAIDFGPVEFSLRLNDQLATLARFKRNRMIMAPKDNIEAASQRGATKAADRLIKESERLRKA